MSVPDLFLRPQSSCLRRSGVAADSSGDSKSEPHASIGSRSHHLRYTKEVDELIEHHGEPHRIKRAPTPFKRAPVTTAEEEDEDENS